MKARYPRRAGARWREQAPAYVLDCFDDKHGNDRYFVLFARPLTYADETGQVYVQCLGMSDAPSHPQGISQWIELKGHDAAAYRYRVGHQRVRWLDLPEHIRAHVIARAKPDEGQAQ